ncbi:MAG: sulfotransferase domain-containing protein [Candidatus Rokuibacteriota bacterium]
MVLIHTGPMRSASTWLEAIFLALAEELPLTVRPRGNDAYRAELRGGGLRDACIYPGVFLPWAELEVERCRFPYRVLHVRRDPRDVLVSSYYSLKYSHVPCDDVRLWRPRLVALGEEDGLLRLMAEHLATHVGVMLSHLDKGPAEHCLPVQFADLVREPLPHVRALLDSCGLALPEDRLGDLVEARSYGHFSGGRAPGVEDVHAHFRKGVPGDWREKFTPRVADSFRVRFGAALVRLGYERTLDW